MTYIQQFFATATLLLLLSLNKPTTAQSVKIGTQTWTSKNLDVTAFRNGGSISYAKSAEDWILLARYKMPAWCYAKFDSVAGKKYGLLYNFYAVNSPSGLAPSGWHIPSDIEWTMLTDFLGGEDSAAVKMKSATGWQNYGTKNTNGNNKSGFNGLPVAKIFYNGTGGANYGFDGTWWTSTEETPDRPWTRSLLYSYYGVGRNIANTKTEGLSVRCVKD